MLAPEAERHAICEVATIAPRALLQLRELLRDALSKNPIKS